MSKSESPTAQGHAGATSEHLKLGPIERSKLQAVVFDANAYGWGRPNLDSLRAIARRLHMVGIQTWLPEPVALEWAHHLSEDWSQVVTAASEERKRLKRAGLKAVESPYASQAEIIAAALEVLANVEYLEVVPLTEASAKKGLEDQILLNGPARRKDGVKTGASDSAWLRDVLARADSIDSLLFVSEDGDISKACREWGLPDPLSRKRAELRPTLFDVTLDEGGATYSVLSYMKKQLPIELENLDDVQPLDIGGTPGLEGVIERDRSDYSDVRVYGAHLTRLSKVVGIDRVTVEVVSEASDIPGDGAAGKVPDELGPVDEKVVTANVFYLANAEATVNRLHMGADPYLDTVTYEDVLVRATLVMETRDGAVTAVRAEDAASTYLPSTNFHNGDEAIEALGDALSVVPGLDLPDDWIDQDMIELELPNLEEHLVIEWTKRDIDEWQISMSLGDDYVEISCSYDVDARVGSGDDMFELYPPYVIAETGGHMSSYANPIWGAAGWIVSRMQ